jgi:hypothetical protein
MDQPLTFNQLQNSSKIQICTGIVREPEDLNIRLLIHSV